MTLPIAPSEAQLTAEQRAAARVTRELRRQLEVASRAITALYVKLAGDIDHEMPLLRRDAFARGASDVISRVHVDVRDELWLLVQAALEAGQSAAWAALIYEPGEDESQPMVQLLSPIAEWIQQLSGTAQERVQALLWSAASAPLIGLPPSKYSDVVAIMGKMHQAVNLLERDTRWATNAAYNQGKSQVADYLDAPRMWVGERDACLHCLAYTGQVAWPREPYPPGLTFYIDPRGRPKPITAGPVWAPPLHPNCRCDQEPINLPEPLVPVPKGFRAVSGGATVMRGSGYPVYDWEAGEVTPAMALQREAKRSVLRGQSGSDSMPARLRAAGALLAAGSGLPRTVEKRARAAIRAGRFREQGVG